MSPALKTETRGEESSVDNHAKLGGGILMLDDLRPVALAFRFRIISEFSGRRYPSNIDLSKTVPGGRTRSGAAAGMSPRNASRRSLNGW